MAQAMKQVMYVIQIISCPIEIDHFPNSVLFNITIRYHHNPPWARVPNIKIE
jgi:hypothetical protein